MSRLGCTKGAGAAVFFVGERLGGTVALATTQGALGNAVIAIYKMSR